MLSLILGFLTGLAGPISTVISKISDLKLAQTQAKSNVEIADINRQISELEDKKAVLIAEAGSRLNLYVRALLTLGPASYIIKVTLWDKVLGSIVGCTDKALTAACWAYKTDPLDTNLWLVVTAIISFYFVTDIVKRK